MNENNFLRTTLLPSVAYGDAFGLPAEGKSVSDIKAIYGEISELQAPVSHPFFPYCERGETSDDTQLSVAVAAGIIAVKGFSLEAQAQSHIDVYVSTGKQMAPGWGRSTIQAMESLVAGVPPEESGVTGGAGNGVVMKLAPLVAWQILKQLPDEERHSQYDALTTMTHDSSVARSCSRLHGDVLAALGGRGVSLQDVVSHSLESVSDSEMRVIRTAVETPAGGFDELVERYTTGKGGKQYGFYVPETLAMAYDIFLSSRGDFATAVQWAANLGGDADSTASIVAAMIDFSTNGTFKKPSDFTDTKGYTELVKTTKRLFEL